MVPRAEAATRRTGPSTGHAPTLPRLSEAQANRLIAALPEADCGQWLPHLQMVEVQRGDVLHEAQCRITHVYFPTTSLLSSRHTLENGASAEVAVVGNEGMISISAFMGSQSTPNQTVVRASGRALRLPAATLRKSFEQGGPVTQVLLRFAQALMTQLAQSAACNRHHGISQQLCRLLLVSIDRTQLNQVWMTHELMANMLGVRREGVTEAALALQKAGVIRYARGQITVLDRAGLQLRCCECYDVVRTEYARLLRQPGVPAS